MVDVVPTCTDHLDPFGSMEVCIDSDIKGILKIFEEYLLRFVADFTIL